MSKGAPKSVKLSEDNNEGRATGTQSDQPGGHPSLTACSYLSAITDGNWNMRQLWLFFSTRNIYLHFSRLLSGCSSVCVQKDYLIADSSSLFDCGLVLGQNRILKLSIVVSFGISVLN